MANYASKVHSLRPGANPIDWHKIGFSKSVMNADSFSILCFL